MLLKQNSAVVNSWFFTVLSKITAAIQRRSQVLLFLLVLFIGVSSVALGSISIKRSIEAPFARDKINSLASAEQSETSARKDTDSDSLFDNDELNVYGTSPYLADSDSDGVSDGEEISKGSDPNCPAGKTCVTTPVKPPASSTGSLSDILSRGSTSALAAPSVAELRNILKQAGLPADQVDALSDEQILQAYNEAVSKTQEPNTASNNSAPTSDSTANLTPAQVREELIKSGVPKEQIENVSDEDLMRIYNETIQEIQKEQSKK